MKKIFDWLDDRSGYRASLNHVLCEPVRGGASFAYVFGSVLTFILVSQALTGILLATVYSPSATDAWASVAYIEDQVTLGWFVRGMHAHGASAMVIVAGIHMLQTALYGAYKKPRELNWLVGVLMLALILAFALTGYLLPWDQRGYWATQVATGIAGSAPVIGPDLQTLVQGGATYGNLTLTRFFAIHVFVLPLMLGALTWLHIALFRRHKQTPPWWRSNQSLNASTQSFWPYQVFKDMVAITLVFLALAAVVLIEGGVGLGAPADPASAFEARPEWYFRPLFQLLKYFGPSLEKWVSLGMPLFVLALLCALPFLDRGNEHSPRKRVVWLSMLATIFLGAALLALASFRDDANDKGVQLALEESESTAREARELARLYGVPAEGGAAIFTQRPGQLGATLWERDCGVCHQGEERSAPLVGPGYNSRDWIQNFLSDPSGDLFFGRTQISKMKPVSLEGADLEATVEYLYSQSGAKDARLDLANEGLEIITEGDCTNCHSTDWDDEGEMGPNLARRGSEQMLRDFIANPSHERWFGETNQMPKQGPYSDEELAALTEIILAWQEEPWEP